MAQNDRCGHSSVLLQHSFIDRFPESPPWLLANHKYKQTEAALRQMARWNGVHVDDGPLLTLVMHDMIVCAFVYVLTSWLLNEPMGMRWLQMTSWLLNEPMGMRWLQMILRKAWRQGPHLLNGLTLIPVCINNYIHCKLWEEVIYIFPNFNGKTVEVWDGYVISSLTLLDMWILIHVLIKVKSY